MSHDATAGTRPALSPWRFVAAFGVVSLLADLVYEGARSITGPLAMLGGVLAGVKARSLFGGVDAHMRA